MIKYIFLNPIRNKSDLSNTETVPSSLCTQEIKSSLSTNSSNQIKIFKNSNEQPPEEEGK